MAKRKRTTKLTRTIKLLTWTDGTSTDTLSRVDTFAPTFNGLTKLVNALHRRGVKPRLGVFIDAD